MDTQRRSIQHPPLLPIQTFQGIPEHVTLKQVALLVEQGRVEQALVGAVRFSQDYSSSLIPRGD